MLLSQFSQSRWTRKSPRGGGFRTAALFLRQSVQHTADDAVGYQEALGGQMPAAVLFHRVARPAALVQEGQKAVEAAAEAGFKFPGVQTLHGAQTQHQPFRIAVQGRNPFTFGKQGMWCFTP